MFTYVSLHAWFFPFRVVSLDCSRIVILVEMAASQLSTSVVSTDCLGEVENLVLIKRLGAHFYFRSLVNFGIPMHYLIGSWEIRMLLPVLHCWQTTHECCQNCLLCAKIAYGFYPFVDLNIYYQLLKHHRPRALIQIFWKFALS